MATRRGITIEQIRNASMPVLLAARRVLGDDGKYVSARETSEKTGLDLESLQRIQRAMGLPTVGDPDAAVYLRADAEAATFAQRFIEMGIEPDQIVQITRLLADGLSRHLMEAEAINPSERAQGQRRPALAW